MTEKEFKDFQSNGVSIVACFSATWCGPCRMFAPVFEKAMEQLPELVFAKIDIDECEQLCDEYGIQSVPTIILFNGTQVVRKKLGGFPTVASFVQWIHGTM